MPSEMLMAFWILSISLVLVPGADWAYAISAGLQEKAVAPAVGGMLIGYVMITSVVAAGVGMLVAKNPALLSLVTLTGAAYLLWLGGSVVAHPSTPSAAEPQQSGRLGWLTRGFVVSGLNPKALLLFVALLPQFTRSSAAWSIPLQIGALGLVQIVNCALVYSLVGLGSNRILRSRPEVARRVSQLSGLAMIVIGLGLLLEQAHSYWPL